MIILYGALRKVFGETVNCKVQSVQELMRAVEANRPGFREHIQKDRKYVIRRGTDFRKAKDVEEAEVEMRFAETTWHILPMPMGYSGTTRLVLGAVLFAAGAIVALNGPTSILSGPFGITMMKYGALLMASGVISMLAPMPDSSGGNSADEEPSYLFDGPTNRTAAGGAVPLAYGFNVVVGSTLVSGGLEIGDIP